MSCLPIYHVAHIVSTIGFVATVIFNAILIFLTIFHTRKITRTYKTLIVVFSALCVLFSFIEMLVHPFYHSYNGALINFNMVKWSGWSQRVVTFLVASYSGVYITIVSFFTVLFVFRYWSMLNSPLVAIFRGWKISFLVFYALIFGIIGSCIVLYCGEIDDYTREYLRDVMMENYDLNVDEVSGYSIIAYDRDGELRWNSLGFSVGVIFVMAMQFVIVGYCGFQMHFKMNEIVENESESHRKLQLQFFKSLVLQITSPTLTFYIPAVAILTVPFLNFEWNQPTGIIVCSFSIYPPLDSLILLCVVSEYRIAIRNIFNGNTSILGRQLKSQSRIYVSISRF